MKSLCPTVDPAALRSVAKVRVLYADTDKLGIVYHASYLRYLEHARVELIRAAGLVYTALEARGLALPVCDLAVRYRAPALYDDVMELFAGVSRLSRVRVHFRYRITVPSRDDVEILTAETRHFGMNMTSGRPAPLPDEVYALLRSC